MSESTRDQRMTPRLAPRARRRRGRTLTEKARALVGAEGVGMACSGARAESAGGARGKRQAGRVGETGGDGDGEKEEEGEDCDAEPNVRMADAKAYARTAGAPPSASTTE